MRKIENFIKKSPLYPALVLEGYFSPQKRNVVIQITKYFLLSLPLLIIVSVILESYGVIAFGLIADLVIEKILGLVLISAGLYIAMHCFEAYFASIYYFEYVLKNRYQTKEYFTFSAGRILKRATNDNLLSAFLQSISVGHRIMKRLGISDHDRDILFLKQAEVKNPPIIDLSGENLIKVSTITNFLYNNFADFQKLLTKNGISQKDLTATVDWVVYQIENDAYDRQWWKPEKLARIPGVATDWSFGRTYLLSKYSRNAFDDRAVNSEASVFSERKREVEQLEAVLAKPTGANAILAGAPGQEKIEVIWNLCRRMKNRTANANLIGKKPIIFQTADFISSVKNKTEFEVNLIKIFTEAMNAGNILLIIDNLPKLILQAKQFDLKLNDIIEPFLTSHDDKIIGLADLEYFHTLIENDQSIMIHFETVLVRPLLLDEIIKVISQEALIIEKTYEITFTYQAILEMAKGAESYFPDGVSTDKARDLLSEIAPWAIENDIEIVRRDNVLDYIGEKTNIPVARISDNEREKLLELENILMKRIVAQPEAIFAIASAIRRNRAGIRNEKRPLGSFLFLGPTGVGKTETAKALAEIFFSQTESESSDEEKLLMRLDMSEYQNAEAIPRLIEKLSTMLRERSYGVLLLDEFEKTHEKVLNLFLQIIDEGFFLDTFGKKVMARNILFIATSNACADKIFEIVSAGKNLKDHKDEIIATIIKQGIFRPELINRFDATVLFHPLNQENLTMIAKMMIQKVAKKIEKKGMTLSIDNDLINFIVRGGYNPSFGARPMNRLIQDTVEEHLADVIIREQLTAGQTVSFKVLADKPEKNSLKPIIT
ncbi:MAG: AAA family ATPase [Candidatus Paceibacterota bacterium]